ncbi:dipeptide ABC transporter ATP-binding protein [Microbacterium indicum]|uniref:dipeptide ABC transporter ATP-binding protein n=1 Tax=Microbacterium indicum TaxID=358100 RepID=UPI00040F9178|nr:ABC transporter ATP-binding protein [Microbacterium indicum]
MTDVLEIDDLHVAFRTPSGDAPAVRGISLAVARGEILAVVGESGSGKSVTAMSVLGLLPGNAVATGSVRVDGQEVLGSGDAALGEVRGDKVAMVFQDPFGALDPVFTVGFQIREVLRRHRPQMGADERRERAVELLRMVDMPEPEKRVASYPHQLSGGQAQRVVIAMALACDPQLLIADEPTTALDVTVQREILDVLRTLRDRTGAGILFITHDMGVVADIADRVVVMRGGQVQETQQVDAIFSAPAASYTRELLAAVPRLTAEPRAARGTDDPVLEIVGLEVTYRRRGHAVKAVEGIDLSIGSGRLLALVGESGSGKSTIGRSVVGLAPVTAGRIAVDGVDVTEASRRDRQAIRRRIGFVFQNPAGALDPRWTIGGAIGEPLRAHSGLRGADLERRVGEQLEAVELPAAWATRYPHELSGGQRQRVSIARALALEPRLLIADEPTSALDVSVQATVLDLLRGLQREHGFACLFISHDLAVVDALADEVAVLNRGRIVERGERTAVLASPQDAYTRRLLDAAPVPDPVAQRARRAA